MSELTNVSSTAKSSASPESLVDRLFQKLALMYGKQWLDLWAGLPIDAVKAEWARTLTGVEPEAMRMALDSLMSQGKAFPPALPEFVSLCRQFARRGPHRLALADKRVYEAPGSIQSLRDIINKAKR